MSKSAWFWAVVGFFGALFFGLVVMQTAEFTGREYIRDRSEGVYQFIPVNMPNLVCVYFVREDKGTCVKR